MRTTIKMQKINNFLLFRKSNNKNAIKNPNQALLVFAKYNKNKEGIKKDPNTNFVRIFLIPHANKDKSGITSISIHADKSFGKGKGPVGKPKDEGFIGTKIFNAEEYLKYLKDG